MDKTSLLKSIAQTGYNIGFGAKKHFISYDLYRIVPKLISFSILAIGIFQLTSYYKRTFIGDSQDFISVALIILGLLALLTDSASKGNQRFNVAGKEMISLFNELRALYNEVVTTGESNDLNVYQNKLMNIEEQAKRVAISDQAICTHIITNLAFFGGGMQIDWIDEQLHFTMKDKFPIFHFESLVLYAVVVILILIKLL